LVKSCPDNNSANLPDSLSLALLDTQVDTIRVHELPIDNEIIDFGEWNVKQ
jgi:hypothetical protein